MWKEHVTRPPTVYDVGFFFLPQLRARTPPKRNRIRDDATILSDMRRHIHRNAAICRCSDCTCYEFPTFLTYLHTCMGSYHSVVVIPCPLFFRLASPVKDSERTPRAAERRYRPYIHTPTVQPKEGFCVSTYSTRVI